MQVIWSPELSFCDRSWSFINPGLCHIKLNKSFDSILSSSPVALQRSSIKGSHEILGYLKDLGMEFISIESKLSHFPSSGQFYHLVNEIGELVSFEESYNTVKEEVEAPSNGIQVVAVKQKRSLIRKKVVRTQNDKYIHSIDIVS